MQLKMLHYYYFIMFIIKTLTTTRRTSCAVNCKAQNCFSDAIVAAIAAPHASLSCQLQHLSIRQVTHKMFVHC